MTLSRALHKKTVNKYFSETDRRINAEHTRSRCIPKFAYPRCIGHISTIMIAASVIIIVITMIHICYYFIIEAFWVKPCNYKESLEHLRTTCNEVLTFLPRSLIHKRFTCAFLRFIYTYKYGLYKRYRWWIIVRIFIAIKTF